MTTGVIWTRQCWGRALVGGHNGKIHHVYSYWFVTSCQLERVTVCTAPFLWYFDGSFALSPPHWTLIARPCRMRYNITQAIALSSDKTAHCICNLQLDRHKLYVTFQSGLTSKFGE